MPAKESKYQYLHKINHPWEKYGVKHKNIARLWIGTIAKFGAAAAVVALYFTDWKLVCGFIPYYNTKFKEEPTE